MDIKKYYSDTFVVFARRFSLKRWWLILIISTALAACGGGEGTGENSRQDPPPDNAPPAPQPDPASAPSDSSLSVSVNIPAEVHYGVQTTMDVSVENADGALTYTLVGGPAGMRIDDTGQITWTPNGIRFGEAMQYTFTVSVSDSNGTATDTQTITMSGDAAYQALVRSSARVPTKANTIHVGDFDGLAGNEVLVTDNRSLIYTLKWDQTLGSSGDFYQEWVYPFSLGNQAYIDAVAAADVNNDGRLDIIVLNGDTVSVIDGESRSLIHSTQIAGALDGYAIAAADIDIDGDMEIVALVSVGTAQERIHIFTLPASGSPTLISEWQSDTANYGNAMVVADVDYFDEERNQYDPQLEINTSKGYVIDGIYHDDEWPQAKPANGFGDKIVAADLDGDGVKEIVGLFSETGLGRLEVYSPEHQSDLFGALNPKREPQTQRCSITATDMDGDGTDEIIVGACLPGGGNSGEYLQILTADTNAAFTSASSWQRPENLTVFYDARRHGGFISLTVGDVDSDGVLDAIWANKDTNDKYDALSVLALPATPSEVFADDVKHQNITLGLFDLAFTGAVDFNYSSTTRYAAFLSNVEPAEKNLDGDQSYNRGARLAMIDYNTGRVQISSQLAGATAVVPGTKLMAVNIFNDPNNDYDQLVFSSALFDDTNTEFSGFQFADFGALAMPGGIHDGWQPLSSFIDYGVEGALPTVFDLADLDGDGDLELAGFIGNYLYSFDIGAASFGMTWQSTYINGEGVDIDIVDLDGDGVNELIHLTDTTLYIRKRDNDSQHLNSPFYDTVFLSSELFQGTTFKALQVADLNSDGRKEIIVAATDNQSSTIYVLDDTPSLLGEITVDGEITDFLLGQSSNSIIAAWKLPATDSAIAASYISEFAVTSDLQSGMEVMRSPALLGEVSADSMNFEAGGRLLIGTRYGMYITQ